MRHSVSAAVTRSGIGLPLLSCKSRWCVCIDPPGARDGSTAPPLPDRPPVGLENASGTAWGDDGWLLLDVDGCRNSCDDLDLPKPNILDKLFIACRPSTGLSTRDIASSVHDIDMSWCFRFLSRSIGLGVWGLVQGGEEWSSHEERPTQCETARLGKA